MTGLADWLAIDLQTLLSVEVLVNGDLSQIEHVHSENSALALRPVALGTHCIILAYTVNPQNFIHDISVF